MIKQPIIEALRFPRGVRLAAEADLPRSKTEEVTVKGSKDLRIWTNNLAVATETLSSLGIPRVEKLQFIDEYPRVTERLVGDPSSQETISAIVGAFQALPPK
jgi:hypothetical protein